MKTILLAAFLLSVAAHGAVPNAAPAASATRPKIHLIGDSTMANKPTDPPNPEHGWGQLLPKFFKEPTMVVNYAMNGRSTKSFIDEGRWKEVVEALQAGDWVIIQFAHNDEKRENPAVFAEARGAYQENLRRFISESRAKQANPILATPVVRRSWDAAGHLVETHGDYPEAMRAVAVAEKIPLLEMNRLSAAMVEGHGVEGSKRIYLWIPPGAYTRQPAGWQDNTHFSAYGAERMAALAVQECIRLELPVIDWLKR